MLSKDEEQKYLDGLINNYPEKRELEEQITKQKSESRKEQIEKIDEITYNGKTVPLKTDKLKQVFKRVESHMHDIQQLQESASFEAGTQISKQKAWILICTYF